MSSRAPAPSSDRPVVVTWGALRDAITELERCLQKYTSLLRATLLVTSVPAIQGNWHRVFTEPWLPDGEDVPEYQRLRDRLTGPRP